MPSLPTNIPAQHVIVEKRTISQCNMAIAMPALPRNDPDRYVLMILNTVLGRGMSSRLFKEVRERRGLAYSVGSARQPLLGHRDARRLAPASRRRTSTRRRA